MNIANIEKAAKLNQFKVVSFDLYDTVLFRPFFNIEDKFKLVSNLSESKIVNFNRKRQQAQREAIQDTGAGNEISLDKIYEQFKIATKICTTEKFIDIEKKVEELAYSFEEISELICRLKDAGKYVICISDMYLDKDFIQKILIKENLYFDEIYISSESGKTKSSGILFEEVISDLKKKGIVDSESEILHIGDNLVSDIKNGKKYGLETISVNEDLNKLNKDDEYIYFNCLSQDLNLKEKILLALIAKSSFSLLSNNSNNLHQLGKELGYKYGGPIILNVANWLYEQALLKRKSNIVLLRRDGFTLLKCLELLMSNGQIENINLTYLPISRVFTYAFNYTYESDIYETIDEHPIKDGTTVDDFVNTRLAFVDEKRLEELLAINHLDRKARIKEIGKDALINFLKTNSSEFFIYACRQKEIIKEFYSNIITNIDDCIFFDLGYTGSSQKSLERIFNQKLEFCYYRTHENIWKRIGENSRFSSFLDISYVKSGENLSPIFEPFFLECAPSLLSIDKIDDQPILKYEKQVGWGCRGILALESIHSGIELFITKFVKSEKSIVWKRFYSKELVKRLVDSLFGQRNKYKTIYSMIRYENSITGENLYLDNPRYWINKNVKNISKNQSTPIAAVEQKSNDIKSDNGNKINAKALRILAEKFIDAGDNEAALKCLYKAAELKPSNKNIRKRITFVYAGKSIRHIMQKLGYSNRFEG